MERFSIRTSSFPELRLMAVVTGEIRVKLFYGYQFNCEQNYQILCRYIQYCFVLNPFGNLRGGGMGFDNFFTQKSKSASDRPG